MAEEEEEDEHEDEDDADDVEDEAADESVDEVGFTFAASIVTKLPLGAT